MRKENKKQKIIITIAIILILVILAIVITTNITNNSQISKEGYLATTANANSNLIASYIKEGVKVGGITGTFKILDTSDATAKPEEISWGKTAYVNGVKITGTLITTVAEARESQKDFSEEKDLLDDYGNNVKVPAGFKVASDSATSVTGGVVIEDVSAGDENTKGSQFVWIPVGNIITDDSGNTTSITLGRYTFGSNGKETLVQSAIDYSKEVPIDTTFTEIATKKYGNEVAKNLGDFVNRTLTIGGYYIGRYEAGDAYATDFRKGSNDISYPDNPVTCRVGAYPYTLVYQPDAAMLSRNMYKSSNFDSDLINSYAWDTALVFIQMFSGDTDYSLQNALHKATILGQSTDIRCNIYDMAEGVREWTTETSIAPESDIYAQYCCVARSGIYGDDNLTASIRWGACKITYSGAAFRIILYLNY